MLVTSRDSESCRRACGDNFKLGVVLYDSGNLSPSANVLLLRQSLDCGGDSIFATFGRKWLQVLQYVITYQEVMAG
jgi:hypothetical protein